MGPYWSPCSELGFSRRLIARFNKKAVGGPTEDLLLLPTSYVML